MDVGVFGGTFDPLHVGHLVVARDALEHLGLDRVCFVPAHRSPFKAPIIPTQAAQRLEMVQRALAGESLFEVSTVEVDRPPPSFTVETLRLLTESEPTVRWTLLLGVDQWASFGAWKDPVEIARLSRIAVLSRDGTDPTAVDPGIDLPWVSVPVTRLDISSSGIRDRIRNGRSVRHLVPEPVREFIESKDLYAPC